MSNAFEKSRTTASTCSWLSRDFARSWVVVINWDSHEWLGLKPCWASARIMCLA